jgi:hypothetical protein
MSDDGVKDQQFQALELRQGVGKLSVATKQMKAITEPSPRITLIRKYLSRAFSQFSGGASISQLRKLS